MSFFQDDNKIPSNDFNILPDLFGNAESDKRSRKESFLSTLDTENSSPSDILSITDYGTQFFEQKKEDIMKPCMFVRKPKLKRPKERTI